jgi:hypothetical protein
MRSLDDFDAGLSDNFFHDFFFIRTLFGNAGRDIVGPQFI